MAAPKFKARLVAEGFLQEYGVDFDKIFSLVVKIITLCFMLNVVAVENLELIQLDVKKVLLHGDVEEEIYMEQPKDFAVFSHEHLVCRLRKPFGCTHHRLIFRLKA